MRSTDYTDGLAVFALAIALFSAAQLIGLGQSASPETHQEARLAAAGWEEAEFGG